MTLAIPTVRGLSLAAKVAQLGAYVLVMWTYADRMDLLDELKEGVRSLPEIVALLGRELVGLLAPGGGGR